MASETGRGAQVRLDDTARQLARGGVPGLRLIDSARQKQALEDSGVAPNGLTPDGSLGNGVPADDEVLLPGGILTGLGGGGGGGAPSYSGGAIVSLGGQFFLVPPGPYADDAAAAAAGVPLGAAYRHTSAVVIVREV